MSLQDVFSAVTKELENTPLLKYPKSNSTVTSDVVKVKEKSKVYEK